MSRFQPWYVRDPENGIEECASAKEAKSTAEGIIQTCTEDGHWPAEIECLQWGRLVAHEVAELEPGPERNGEPTYGVKLARAGDLYVPASKLREVVAELRSRIDKLAVTDEERAMFSGGMKAGYEHALDFIESLLGDTEENE